MTKQTVEQWQKYVDGIPADELVETTENANSVGFVRAMQEEGYDAEEIHRILTLFARRWQKLGQRPPEGGYIDLAWLAEQK
jgi:hypothetical protein